MIAGKKLAAAVPDVHARTTGRRVRFAIPSAKNEAERSSRIGIARICRWRASAIASGAERDPGATTPVLTPSRTSVSAKKHPHKLFVLEKSRVVLIRLNSESRPNFQQARREL